MSEIRVGHDGVFQRRKRAAVKNKGIRIVYDDHEVGSSTHGVLAAGCTVEHETFGRGSVLQVEGSGLDARAVVAFVEHGTKKLLLRYARLRVIE